MVYEQQQLQNHHPIIHSPTRRAEHVFHGSDTVRPKPSPRTPISLRSICDLVGWNDSPISNHRSSPRCASQQLIDNSQIDPDILDSIGLEFPLEEKAYQLLGVSGVANHGSLPTIQWAIQHKCSTSTIRMLLDANEESAVSRDENGNIPLHIAVMNCLSEEMVALLLCNNRQSVFIKNNYGNTALHLAAQCNASNEVVKLLVDADKASVAIPDKNGMTSIHLAITCGASPAVVETMLNASPKMALQKDSEGRTPFTLAIKHRSSEAILKILLDFFRKTATLTKRNGRTLTKRVRFSLE
eukprot:CAMPEP_0116017358 /NCGR_PEP_ID=MMETSP0321-20121206/8001_1 /TAXON_ID=163516 /ORGANISM="Leptocylindrus danicus var. danicus, Strain B650" /LENGTH=297 /DNA_ID=CAMNT_0003487537 /DNA_START=84 /DNA_END=977 /DNA_ORIENTATION=-